MEVFQMKPAAKNAVYIGIMCSFSYLAVYVARNILSAVTPQMTTGGFFTKEEIGTLSSVYFITYAVGQLINGAIGDKIKAKYMISFGLLFAAVCNFVFPFCSEYELASAVAYGASGFFLSMIYGPMTKIIAENTEPFYATRCALGFTFASFFGSPSAGLLASFMVWQSVFNFASGMLVFMAIICFAAFTGFERRGVIKYNQFDRPKGENKLEGVRELIRHKIIRYTFISILTGIIRTTVVFWMPTYFNEYLGYSDTDSALIFTVTTLIISFAAFVSVFTYERLHRNMELTMILFFILSTVFFILLYFVHSPLLNIILLVLAVMASNCSASMLWSRYCPSLRDTGMVSSATGFIDFVSYMAASVSSTIFASAATTLGWGNLILVWAGIVGIAVIVMIPFEDMLRKKA